MTGTAKVLRYAGFSILVVFGVVGGLFVAGYAFEDLSTWAAIGSTAAWALPAVGLCVTALLADRVGPPMFVALTVVVAALTVLDSTFGWVDRDAVGPVAAIGVFALGVSLGFLGLRRTSLAGLLVGVVFLVSGALSHDTVRAWHLPPPRVAH